MQAFNPPAPPYTAKPAAATLPGHAPPAYSLVETTAHAHPRYPRDLVQDAMRDLRASQDPNQWGTRRPRHHLPPRVQYEEVDQEEEEVHSLLSWVRWLARLLEPAVPEEGMQVWTTMGPIGRPVGLM